MCVKRIQLLTSFHVNISGRLGGRGGVGEMLLVVLVLPLLNDSAADVVGFGFVFAGGGGVSRGFFSLIALIFD